MVKLTEFDATSNKSQDRFLRSLFTKIVPKAIEEPVIVVLSGAMGSGKSLAVQFALTLLCIDYPGIACLVSRISIKDVKRTFFAELKEMIPDRILKVNTKERLEFINNSSVQIAGYGGGDTSSLRSLNLNIAVIEEVSQDAIKAGYYELNKKALNELIGRVRNKHGPNIIFLISNPDSPSHWLYEEYISKSRYVDGKRVKGKDLKDNVYTFYSITTDNKSLSKGYVENMSNNFTKTMKARMIDGKWVDVLGLGIYNEYSEELHYKRSVYKNDITEPVYLCWDFNTAEGKPMSVCIAQFIKDHFHFYDEMILPNSKTRTVLTALEAEGFFHQFKTQELLIDGDGAGWSKDAAATYSNYNTMKNFIDALPYEVNYRIIAPHSNPAISRRHNITNAYLLNFKNEVRISVYEKCKVLNKGFKSTKFKQGTQIEDDSNYNQHVTTASTYLIFNRL